MSRYFIEVFYKGTQYAGFQIQQNANTIQAEIEKALGILYKSNFELTCSSRTDTGVHAMSNYFHFDSVSLTNVKQTAFNQSVYNINAILPQDIVVKRIFEVAPGAHCRFDAISRQYRYYIYQSKNPFLADRAYYYPYRLDIDILNQAAKYLMEYEDFSSFSKKHTQVKTSICKLYQSEWSCTSDSIVYDVVGNRFLRGMVRGLVGTMLKVGTGKLSLTGFKNIIEEKDASKANFAVPAQGLFLMNVNF